ncbi:MAG: hypothetical protein R3240_07815, partial [Gammaproteobacteria bacterium]|nr:hypothetical protein [Gammaproteobacteria bacterium]
EHFIMAVSNYFDNHASTTEKLTFGTYTPVPGYMVESPASTTGPQDLAGNNRSFETHVFLDRSAPTFELELPTLTNVQGFDLNGSYQEEGAGLKNLTVNGVQVNVLDNNQWSHHINLQSGANELVIRIEDKAGNFSAGIQNIVLDDLAPVIQLLTDNEVRYANADGSYYSAVVSIDGVAPLYIESSKLSLSAMAVTRQNLLNANIPFYEFKVNDQSLYGLETGLNDLTLEFRYLQNSEEKLSWQPLSIDPQTGNAVLPLVSEYLTNAWYTVLPADEQQLQLRLKDLAGNVAQLDAMFKARIFVPAQNLQLDTETSTIANGDFANRQAYVNNEVAIASYTMHNDTGMPFKIQLTDSGQHKVDRDYDEANRVNLMEVTTEVQWQRSGLTTLGGITVDPVAVCPELDGKWERIETIYNYDSAGNPNPITLPPVTTSDETVNSDVLPTPPIAEWLDYVDPDEDFNSYPGGSSTGNIYFKYDYVENPDKAITKKNPPARITAWHYYDESIPLFLPCNDVVAIQQKNIYSYQQKAGYPRVDVVPQSDTTQIFSTSRFSVMLEDGTEITSDNGWFEIPVNQTVKIIKYAQTPDMGVYDDTTVASDASIRNAELTSYDHPYKYDSLYHWTIDRNINVSTQFNPANLEAGTGNLREQSQNFDALQVDFARN